MYSFFNLIAFFSFLMACQNPTTKKEETIAAPTVQSLAENPLDTFIPKVKYTWLQDAENSSESALRHQIPVPDGFERLPVAAGSFAEWLRYLPLLPANTKVMLFNNTEKPYQDGAFRVVNIDIGNADLQQCADAIMRLKAEYHYSKNEYDKIHFNYTSGDKVSFDDWRKGRQPKVSNSKIYFTSATGNTDNSYTNFKKYLRSVFMYAGTASLSKELKMRSLSQMQIGDVFIKGGFPGHAVLVMDMAENPQTGERVFLLAQSYMPAQSIHILRNPNNNALSPWYSTQLGDMLYTPEWDFAADALKYFAE